MQVMFKLVVGVSVQFAILAVAAGQQTPVPPSPTGMPAHPFFITKTWVIGGVGNWDYLTMDPTTRELFIAHGPTVQVVNVDSGTVAGSVKGFRQAHHVVLDSQGAYGYVSDGQADLVRVFDRHSFEVVANIPTGPTPRSMALDAGSGLLFVVGGQPASADRVMTGGPGQEGAQRATEYGRGVPRGPESSITVIDAAKRTPLAQLVIPGELGFAQGDGDGRIYVTVLNRNQIMRLDAQAIGNALHQILDGSSHSQAGRSSAQPKTSLSAAGPSVRTPVLEWYPGSALRPPAEALPYSLDLGSTCEAPSALAMDTSHARLFAACNNFKMVVINPETSSVITSLPIGPAPEAIVYDANRSLIFTANGGGDGSLTIVRQDVTDTYSVIQTLPTRQYARTLAIDPATGNVFLTTVLYGAAMNTPMTNGRPAPLKVSRVDNSFQILVVGN